MADLNWAALQQEAKTAGVLPDGDYSCIVTETTATSSSTGKPMIKTKFRVIEGPHEKKPVYTQFVISAESPVALRIFFQHMAAFGLDANFFGQNPSLEEVARNLVNRGVVLTLGTRQWQGADRNEVNGVKALPVGGPLPPGLVQGPPSVGVSPTSSPSPAAGPTPTTPVGPTPSVPGPPPTIGAAPVVGPGPAQTPSQSPAGTESPAASAPPSRPF